MIRLLPAKDLHRSGLVARVFALRDVVLAELNAKRVRPFDAVASQEDARIRFNLEDAAEAALSEDGAVIVANVRFVASALDVGGAVLTVTAQFELRYERQVSDVGVSTEDVKLFASINAVYNAWPYMRELVANTFTRFGYPPFTMESLVISPAPDESKALSRSP